MSRRNREKRAAKQKDRRRATADREQSWSWAGPDRDVRQHLLVLALRAAAMCSCGETEMHVADLLADVGSNGRDLDIAADTAMGEAVREVWERGWSPVDLYEIGRRRLEESAVELLAEAIIVESRRYAPATLHPRWRAGLATVSAVADPAVETPRVQHWANGNAPGHAAAMTTVLRVLALLGSLPAIERLVPLPGASRHSAPTVTDAATEVDEKALAKVRALLAKAESTEFPDEAEALSAKAQELMSRYSLHQAVLDHGRGRAPTAVGRRLWMDAPYAGAKSHLVDAVATANRCRAVWTEALGIVTVIGAATELDLVELLTTSLLVQANRAMLAAGRHVTRGGRSRTKSFRQSFLLAYASRIGERLDAASTAGTGEAREDSRLLPVLAARSRAADDMTERLFPHLVSRAVPVSNAAGWSAGRAAADLALFNVHAPIAG